MAKLDEELEEFNDSESLEDTSQKLAVRGATTMKETIRNLFNQPTSVSKGRLKQKKQLSPSLPVPEKPKRAKETQREPEVPTTLVRAPRPTKLVNPKATCSQLGKPSSCDLVSSGSSGGIT